jgi:hypothetical protein
METTILRFRVEVIVFPTFFKFAGNILARFNVLPEEKLLLWTYFFTSSCSQILIGDFSIFIVIKPLKKLLYLFFSDIEAPVIDHIFEFI